jgi:RES domain-containing protein
MKAKHATDPLDREGARRVGGRWNAPGVPVAYCASSLSLAVLELLVHVDAADIPNDLVAVEVEIPDRLAMRRLVVADLPAKWREEAARGALQVLGGTWVRDGLEVGLVVPSVIVPGETNILLNPLHPDAGKVQIIATNRFVLDPRLF